MLEDPTVLAIAVGIVPGAAVRHQQPEFCGRRNPQPERSHQRALQRTQHGPDLLFGRYTAEDRPREAVQKVRAGDGRIRREPVAAGTQVHRVGLVRPVDEAPGEEIAFPRLLKPLAKDGTEITPFLFGRAMAFHAREPDHVGPCDLEQETVHQAFRQIRFQRVAFLDNAVRDLLAVEDFLLRSMNALAIEVERVVPIGPIEQREAILADRNLPAVLQNGEERVEEPTSASVFSGYRPFAVENAGVAGQIDETTDGLKQPQCVVGITAGLHAGPVELMIGIAEPMDMAGPDANKVADMIFSARRPFEEHGGQKILYLAEADLPEPFLR